MCRTAALAVRVIVAVERMPGRVPEDELPEEPASKPQPGADERDDAELAKKEEELA